MLDVFDCKEIWREIRGQTVPGKRLMSLLFIRKMTWLWRISIKTKVLATSFPMLRVIYCAVILRMPPCHVSKAFSRLRNNEKTSVRKNRHTFFFIRFKLSV